MSEHDPEIDRLLERELRDAVGEEAAERARKIGVSSYAGPATGEVGMKRCMLLATLGAATLLCAAVGTASARNFSLSSQTLRAVWSQLEVSEQFGVTVRCQLTLEGSFHARTQAKVAGSLIGYINRATLGGCPIFEWRLLTETLPWHLRYRQFTGVLPNIVSYSMSLVGFALRIRDSLGRTCLGTSTAAEPLILTTGGGWRASGSFPYECEGVGGNRFSFAGTGTGAPTITLI